MTDKQKRAVKLLNKLWNANGGIMTLSEDEYFLLMDFVFNEPQLTEGVLETLIDDLHKLSEKQGEQKHHEYTLEQAAGIFLDALSNTPYNNKPITDAQFITKELLKFLEDASSYNPNAINEQAPADKVEPKFHKGEWIVWQNKCYKVNYNGCGYELIDQNGLSTSLEYGTIEENAHLWTIQDAKEGDVLSWDDSKCIALFKNIYDENSFNSYGFVGHCTGTFESRQSYHDIEGAHPATKEQRDTLFAKMKEAGYEWNAEKKELRKIEQKLANSAKTCKNDTLLDLLNKIPSYITVDGFEYYFVMKKTSIYTAYYKALPIDSPLLPIFGITAHSPIDLLAEMLEILKEKGLLE